MNNIKAMKQWLYALEMGRDAAFQAAEMFHLEMRGYKQQRHEALDAEVTQIDEAIATLRTAIEAAESQQPVAWGNLANWCLDSDRVLITDKTEAEKYHRDVYDLTPLYTTPPAAQRQWVGLTDEEILAEVPVTTARPATTFARAIEAKLKEKNHG